MLTVKNSILRSLKVIAASLLFVWLAWTFLIPGDDGNKVIAWGCFLFFSVTLIKGIVNLFDRRAKILIDANGIYFPGRKKRIIDWSEIKEFEIERNEYQDIVWIELKEGEVYDIRMEYFEHFGAATAKLGWTIPESTSEDAAALAADCDAAIVVAGLSHQFEGEGYDRNTLKLPGEQDKLIRAVAAANPRTAVVLINGTPIDMEGWIAEVPALVEAWYPGELGGHAVARILFGDVNPSGKLPDTFAKRLEDYPSQANYPGRDGVVRYEEGIWVGYRYFDTKGVEPRFPFGHGLSYTTSEYDNLRVEPDTNGDRLVINATFDVRNTGARAGAEVAQVYVHDVQSSVERPAKELKGFRKVHLQPGATATVTVPLDTDSLSFYDVNRKRWIAEPGEFEILIGSSSADIRLRGGYVFQGR